LPTLNEVITLARCSRDEFNNWRRGHHLSWVGQTSQGIPIDMPQKAALALAFLAPLVRVGVPPSIASGFVRDWVKSEENDKLERYWRVNPSSDRWRRGDFSGHTSSRDFSFEGVRDEPALLDQTDGAEWTSEVGEDRDLSATVLVTIDRAEIVSRVDTLFGRSLSGRSAARSTK
jgi:hypothetical protein